MCSVKLVRVVCRLTSGWGSTLTSSHSEKCGAEGAKGDHTHWLGSRGCLLDSLIGSVLTTAVSLRLLHCSMQRMIAIIRIVVRSNPIDAMRSSNIMLCFSTTIVVVWGLEWRIPPILCPALPWITRFELVNCWQNKEIGLFRLFTLTGLDRAYMKYSACVPVLISVRPVSKSPCPRDVF